jgi:hypothetical protein
MLVLKYTSTVTTGICAATLYLKPQRLLLLCQWVSGRVVLWLPCGLLAASLNHLPVGKKSEQASLMRLHKTRGVASAMAQFDKR